MWDGRQTNEQGKIGLLSLWTVGRLNFAKRAFASQPVMLSFRWIIIIVIIIIIITIIIIRKRERECKEEKRFGQPGSYALFQMDDPKNISTAHAKEGGYHYQRGICKVLNVK